ncbi:hypothetical protein GPA27_23395 [Aromatoleum toluolicum]|uniref:hypothetical protein n=1 Tax=Aromatoleum toluolicum TaxID=90060 RepID=UPI002108821C|nr:hypothetical protein [Aromatoleum toluolicum]NMG00326.2 hypothetical protein [Aromatoleum toluolicum]
MIRLVRACFLLVSLLAAPCALAQIVIVAGARSPLPDLTPEQAEQFYLGRAHTLPDGSVVTLADLPTGAVRDQFYQQLTRKNANQIRAHWSRMVFTGRALPPQQAESVAQLRLWLAAQPNLIGYMPAAEADGRVRVLLRLP